MRVWILYRYEEPGPRLGGFAVAGETDLDCLQAAQRRMRDLFPSEDSQHGLYVWTLVEGDEEGPWPWNPWGIPPSCDG